VGHKTFFDEGIAEAFFVSVQIEDVHFVEVISIVYAEDEVVFRSFTVVEVESD